MIVVEDFKPHAATLKQMGWDYPDDIQSLSGVEALLLMNLIQQHQKTTQLENQVKYLKSKVNTVRSSIARKK